MDGTGHPVRILQAGGHSPTSKTRCSISAMGSDSPASDGPRIVPPDEGREVTIMGARVRYLLPADGPAPGRFSVIEYTVPAFFAAPPALHHRPEEDWAGIVLEGSVTFELRQAPRLPRLGRWSGVRRGLRSPGGMTVISQRGCCTYTPQGVSRNSFRNSPALWQRLARRR